MNECEKSLLIQKLQGQWYLPADLFGRDSFGDGNCEINDFGTEDYVYFLNNVKTLEEMIEGFRHLSPLADDALSAAKSMNGADFQRFKKALAYERRQDEKRRMPKKYLSLVLPERFLDGYVLAEEFRVTLGTALIRLVELE